MQLLSLSLCLKELSAIPGRCVGIAEGSRCSEVSHDRLDHSAVFGFQECNIDAIELSHQFPGQDLVRTSHGGDLTAGKGQNRIGKAQRMLRIVGGSEAPALFTVTLPDSDETFVISVAEGSSTTVAEGGSFSFKIYVEDGYTINYVEANGEKLTADGSTYTIESITGDISVVVSVKPIEYEIKAGDVNLDGVVDQSDLALLHAYVLGQKKLNKQQLGNGDVNADGVCDQSDVVKLYSYVLDQIDSLE